jgi:hypothetical protein
MQKPKVFRSFTLLHLDILSGHGSGFCEKLAENLWRPLISTLRSQWSIFSRSWYSLAALGSIGCGFGLAQRLKYINCLVSYSTRREKAIFISLMAKWELNFIALWWCELMCARGQRNAICSDGALVIKHDASLEAVLIGAPSCEISCWCHLNNSLIDVVGKSRRLLYIDASALSLFVM